MANHIAFARAAVDRCRGEAERMSGHVGGSSHRTDVRVSASRLAVSYQGTKLVDSDQPIVLYESGLVPRWYVPRADIADGWLTPVELTTFCPYKGICRYYDVGDVRLGAWTYLQPFREVELIRGYVSFEPDKLEVSIDGRRLEPEPSKQPRFDEPERNLASDEAEGDGGGVV